MIPAYLQLFLALLAFSIRYKRDAWAREETLRMEAGDFSIPSVRSKSWLRKAPSPKWQQKLEWYDGWHRLGWVEGFCWVFAVELGWTNYIYEKLCLLCCWAISSVLYRLVFNPKKS